MRKNIILFVVCGVFLGSSVWIGYHLLQSDKPKTSVSVSDQQKIPRVTLTLDDSVHIATYSGIPASTAFSALQYVSEKNTISIKTKQYDFGVFVEQIGDKPNTSDRAWLYSVNGISAEVASDTYNLYEGDTVLWQYIAPIF